MNHLFHILNALFLVALLQFSANGMDNNAEAALTGDPLYRNFSGDRPVKTFSDDNLSSDLFCYIRHDNFNIYLAIAKIENQMLRITHSNFYQIGANEISCISKMGNDKFIGIAWYNEKQSFLQYVRITKKTGAISSETFKTERRNFAFFMSPDGSLTAIYAVDEKVHIVDLSKGSNTSFDIAGLISNSPCYLAILDDSLRLFVCKYAKIQGSVDYSAFEIWEIGLNEKRQIKDQTKIGGGKLGPWGPPKGFFSIEEIQNMPTLELKSGLMDESQSVTATVKLNGTGK